MTDSSRWDTLHGALHAVRLLTHKNDPEMFALALLQSRDADIQIKFAGVCKGCQEFLWWSERFGRWEISTLAEIIDNTTLFRGPFEVRRAE